jgi:hypothetical protein
MVRPDTLHTLGELDTTDTAPSPVVDTCATKDPPTIPDEGRFVMVGTEAVGRVTIEVAKPSAPSPPPGMLAWYDPVATQRAAEGHEIPPGPKP